MEDTQEIKEIKIDFNPGKAILRFADMFSDPILALLQAIQNALDAKANEIIIEIHSDKPLPKRRSKKTEGTVYQQSRIMVYDNGQGVSLKTMAHKLSHICDSLKDDDPDALGDKGTGLLAGLGIGKKHSIVTKEQQEKTYFSLELDRDQIKALGENGAEINIVPKKINKPSLLEGMTTLVMTKGVANGTIRILKNDLSGLAQETADRFGHKIAQLDAKITFKYFEGKNMIPPEIPVQGFNFPGERKESVKIKTEFGEVNFEMHFSPIAQKEVKILIRVKSKESFLISRSVTKALSEKARELFSSGHIHGIIVSDFGEETTTKNDLVSSEEKDALLEAIETFCAEHASKWSQKAVKTSEYEPAFRKAITPLLEVCKKKPSIIPISLGGVVSEGHIKADSAQGIKLLFDNVTKGDQSSRKGGEIEEHKSGRLILLDGAHLKNQKRERPIEHVNVQDKSSGKKRVALPNQPGITVLLADGSRNHSGQRSWVENGVICVNYAHTSFGRAFDEGPTTTFATYIDSVVSWEILLATLQDNKDPTAHGRRQDINRIYMPFFESIWFS